MNNSIHTVPADLIPQQDADRLETLRRFRILYTEPESEFEELTQLMRETFGVDMSFISLVDEKAVFFKSKQGPFEEDIVSRELSLCSITVKREATTVFEDTESEVILQANPFVQAEGGIKFYAGAPLVTSDGFAIGTACIVHTRPRNFSEKEKVMLQRFARIVMRQIEQRLESLRHNEELEEKVRQTLRELVAFKTENQAYQLFLQAPVAISIYKGEDLVIEMANDVALKIAGKTSAVIGKKVIDMIPEVEQQGYIGLLQDVMRTGRPYEAIEAPVELLINGRMQLFYFNLIYQPFFNAVGEVTGVINFSIDVTEQVAARKRIQESEQRFRNVLEQSPYPIFILKGAQLVLEVANQPLFDLWAVDQSALGKPFLSILPEMKDQGFHDLILDVYTAGNTHYGYEVPAYFIREGRQQQHYFNFVYHPYKESDGTISGVLVMATDITGQVQAKKKIAQSEAHFRSMIQQAPVGICIIRKEDLVVEIANDNYLRIINMDRATLEGQSLAFVVPEARPYLEILSNVFRTGRSYSAREHAVEIIRGDFHELVYLDFVFEPMQEEADQVSRLMILVIDVTEKVLARKKIEQAESRARLAVESAELGTFEVDLQTNTLMASRRLDEIFGVTVVEDREQLIKRMHPDDIASRDQAYTVAFQTGMLEYEARVLLPGDGVKWIKVKGNIQFDDQQKPQRIQGVVMDISEQKLFAEELSRQIAERTRSLTLANEQLIKKNEELDQFAFAASHDLQEPLRKITIFNKLIQERLAGQEEVKVYLEKTSQAAARMNALIKSLLDYSRLASEASRFEPVDLVAVFAQVLEDYELLIEQKGATLVSQGLETIEGIPLQLNQLFFNLIGNSLKFTREGVQPVIEVVAAPLPPEVQRGYPQLRQDKTYCQLQFRDNGIGFNQAYASKVFTIFQQLNERSQYSGYGIGLSLCRKIADNHEGLIFAEGWPQEGATFTVLLPYRQL